MIETLGNTGDFLGGVGVLVTLVAEFWELQKAVFSPEFQGFVEQARSESAGAPAPNIVMRRDSHMAE